MSDKEKVRKYYQKIGIGISEQALETILKDKQRTKGIIELYKQEEIESMNYILGKSETNLNFSEFELEAMSKIDLFDKKVVAICKIIWNNKYKPEKLQQFLEQLENSSGKEVNV